MRPVRNQNGGLSFPSVNWFAIYTKPAFEDSIALQLRKAGIQTLTPKIRTKRYYRGKFTSVIEPLFPCYIFALFDPEKHGHMIGYTRGVRYVIGKQTPIIVPRLIIEVIQTSLEGDIVFPVLEKLEKGDRVFIREGPFSNFYGIFERDVPGRERAMILLETLHCKLEIEKISLRKTDSA